MYEAIQRLASEALALQNKLEMEKALQSILQISREQLGLADSGGGCVDDGPIAAGDVLVGADGSEFPVAEVLATGATTTGNFPAALGGAEFVQAAHDAYAETLASASGAVADVIATQLADSELLTSHPNDKIGEPIKLPAGSEVVFTPKAGKKAKGAK